MIGNASVAYISMHITVRNEKFPKRFINVLVPVLENVIFWEIEISFSERVYVTDVSRIRTAVKLTQSTWKLGD